MAEQGRDDEQGTVPQTGQHEQPSEGGRETVAEEGASAGADTADPGESASPT